ncbi:nucleotidyltransferase domain-containing protein [Parashewanella spongiae]|uniref:Nucleotidyltransferase domain-containing protein n=1 Tax=Parashewanella spongiae TaxID=342950 RepID=A0A3A6TJL5_9GAMM|nr:nucleotidyltransferase domain-containing protein [Parashewanella spongiae]MCL1078749.1 nucleotidyltransferase domain-containing protein [Parashewanella spongiae]RJY12507.1 nucleotidyltransferase domain-containing protein [Parashewanella spongiae]
MIEIRKKDLLTIKHIAANTLIDGSKLWAYGSRVKGTSYEASDLDLVIITPKGKVNDIVDFREKLQESTLPILVQAYGWEYLPEHFKASIKTCYEEILF